MALACAPYVHCPRCGAVMGRGRDEDNWEPVLLCLLCATQVALVPPPPATPPALPIPGLLRRRGRRPRGWRKLTPGQGAEILAHRAAGVSWMRLSAQYGCSKTTLVRIQRGEYFQEED